MAITYTDNGGGAPNGSDKEFTYSFPVIQTEDVKVALNGVTQATTKYTVDNVSNPTKITFNNTSVDSSVQNTSGAPKSGVRVRVYRETTVGKANGDEDPKAVFAAGSSIRAIDLNANQEQSLMAIHELQTRPIETEDIQGDAIVGSLIADSQIDSEHYVDGSIDREHLEPDIIDNSKLADNAVQTENILNGTIVDADINASAEIEVYKLKDGAANQVLVTQSDGTTVNWSSNINLPGNLDVTGTLDSTGNVDFDANLNVDGNTTLNNLSVSGNSTLTGDIIVNGGSTLNNLRIGVTTGNEIDTVAGSLNLDSASGQTTIDDNLNVTGACQVNGVNVVTETGTQTLTNKTLTTPVINDLSGTAVVTSGTSTSDNKVYSAKRAGEIFYGKGTVEEIQSGETWTAADDKVATTAAIDARIIDLVDDVGGFVPIASETNFPTANPDVNNGSGTLVSIKTIGSTRTPSSGTVTIANGAGTGNTVTITGCGSTVLTAGFGVIVETTSTLHTYAFHRLVPKATEVTTVATNATQVQTVHTNISNINTVASDIANVNAVAADATDIGVVAGKATEIGRLGTADAVADMALLGTADVVSDLNTLGTADVVADMNMLATSDVIADMNMLAVSDVISDMNALATTDNITAMDTCRDNIASINNASANISSVNNFGDKYQVAASNPSTDGGGNALAEGDLYFNTTANELKVYNGGAWQGGVTASGNFASTTGNTFTGDNRYNDNAKALFGTGSDLEIFHNGSNATLTNSTGYIQMRASSDQIYIDGTTVNLRNLTSETLLKGIANNAVELYYDNVKKFITQPDGVSLIGSDSNNYSTIGRLKAINSTTTASYIDFRTAANSTSGDIVFYTKNTGTFSEKLFISHDGVVRVPDNVKYIAGTGNDLQIYHDGSNSLIDDTGTGHLNLRGNQINIKNTDDNLMLVASGGGAVNLYNNGSKKFETTTTGVIVTGGLTASGASEFTEDVKFDGSTAGRDILFDRSANKLHFADHSKAVFGESSDIEIYHNGSINAINLNNAFNLEILHNADTIAKFIPNGAVKLFYDNSKKLETSSTGVTIDGRLNMTEGIDIPDGGDNNTSLSIGSGNDLRLYHDGNNSYIKERGTGNLNIQSANTVEIEKDNGTDIARFHPDGEVELFYDGSRKLNTTSTGVALHGLSNGTGNSTLYYNSSTGQVLYGATPATDLVSDTSPELGGNLDAGTRNIEFNDNGKLRFGTGNDFEIYHKSADNGNYIESQNSRNLFLEQDQIFILNEAGNEYMIHGVANGAVSLYYNNSKKLETDNSGVTIGGATAERLKLDGSVGDCILASSGAEIQFTRNNQNNITCTGDSSTLRLNGDSKLMANFIANGAAELYHNGTKRLETTSLGVKAEYYTGEDNAQLRLGNSGDLQIYHEGTNSVIKNNTGYLQLLTSYFAVNNNANNENIISALANGAVNLYYDDSKKFETTSIGAQVTGQFVATQAITAQTYMQGTSSNGGLKLYSDSTASMGVILDTGDDFRPTHNNQSDLGAPSYRWRNIYTNDLNLSNEGSSNDMDGTWGDWTIQEGKSDLFLKNNRSGKKYKFNLTEVS